MSASIDSKPAFRAELEDFQLGAYYERFAALPAMTIGEFAFCSSFVPGASPEQVFIDEILSKILKLLPKSVFFQNEITAFLFALFADSPSDSWRWRGWDYKLPNAIAGCRVGPSTVLSHPNGLRRTAGLRGGVCLHSA